MNCTGLKDRGIGLEMGNAAPRQKQDCYLTAAPTAEKAGSSPQCAGAGNRIMLWITNGFIAQIHHPVNLPKTTQAGKHLSY